MMTADKDSARDDLAFLRALVNDGSGVQTSLGAVLLAGGLIYGGQCILQWLPAAGLVAVSDLTAALTGIVPTLVFILAIVVIHRRFRGTVAQGSTGRALHAAFGGSGLAALVSAVIFGYLAVTRGDLGVWALHPIVICIIQGTVWYTAFVIRRQRWLGLVSAGWFTTAVGLVLLIPRHWFVLLIGAALFMLMALPGWVLMRSSSPLQR